MIIDNKSKSLSYRLGNGLHLISLKLLNNLEKKKLKNISIFRLCLNSTPKNKFHQMIIFQKNTYIPTIKKELKKDKSFILWINLILYVGYQKILFMIIYLYQKEQSI